MRDDRRHCEEGERSIDSELTRAPLFEGSPARHQSCGRSGVALYLHAAVISGDT